MDAKAPGGGSGSTEPGPAERRLLTRIAELEAELVAERRAASAARELVAELTTRADDLERALWDTRRELDAPPGLRDATDALATALRRRVRRRQPS